MNDRQLTPASEKSGHHWTFAWLLLIIVSPVPYAVAQENAPSAQESTTSQPAENKLGKSDADPFTVSGRLLDVSGEPAADAIVHVRHTPAEVDTTATTDGNGEFRIEIRLAETARQGLKIAAHSSDGSSMAFYRATSGGPTPGFDAIELRLEPTKLATVIVVDASNRPIADANVALQLSYPNTLGPLLTDVQGRVSFQLPDTESVESVVAWKDHLGLDYKLYTLLRGQQSDKLTKKPEFPFDSVETLKLEGASPLTIRMSDAQGDPIEDSYAYVWLLQKDAKQEQLNLSYFHDCFLENADHTGEVVFNWFPTWQTGATTVWPTAEGFVRSRGVYDPSIHNGKLNLQLDRLIPLRGTVTLSDGTPAVGVSVAAAGAGYAFDNFRGAAKTNDMGQYEIMAAPNQIYMLYIEDQKWSAPVQSGFAVLPGKEVEDHDFVLRPATRLFGQVLNKANGQPLEGKLIYLTLHGIDLNAMGKGILPNPESSNRWVSPMRQLNAQSKKDGSFEFFIGPGDYNLFIQGFDAEKFSIDDELEKHVDLRILVQPKQLLTGLVISAETNEPIEGVLIEAVSRNFRQHNDWKATTTKDGKFQVDRIGEATYLHATSKDTKLGAILEIAATETAVVLQLKQVGMATGRLMSRDGSEPAVGVKLRYGVRIEDEKDRLSTSRFGQVVTTGPDGRFTLPNLVPEWEYECTLEDHPNGYVLNVAKAKVVAGESLDLGELRMPEEPKPYVPPTLEERIETDFSVAGTPLERFQKAKQLVGLVNQNLLIVFATPKDPTVHSLMKIRYEDQDFRFYRDDFRFMAIPTDPERLRASLALAEELGIDLPEDPKAMLLVVVDHAGEVVAQIESKQIVDGDELSKTRLLDRLDKYKTTPIDARLLLDEALGRAAREGKRVLVQETATWCGPCHQLSRLLLANRQWEKDYVWVKMDHRWTGAREIMQEIRDGAEGGIPWFAILNPDGEKLATSNLPDSGQNIGFPSEVSGQKHFAEMLQSTSHRMTAQEIQDLAAAAGKN